MAGAGGAVVRGWRENRGGAAVGTIDIRPVEHYRHITTAHSLKEVLVRFRRARYEDLWALQGVTMRVEREKLCGRDWRQRFGQRARYSNAWRG